MNLKQRKREEMTKERQHSMATGRGLSKSDPDAVEVIPAHIVGIDTATDSDADLEITDDYMVQPAHIEEVTVAAPFDPDHVVTEAASPVSTAMSETAPTVVPSVLERRPTTQTGQSHKDSILEREYKDRQMRANKKHKVEMRILHKQLREAKAKAELAELILRQKQCSSDLMP